MCIFHWTTSSVHDVFIGTSFLPITGTVPRVPGKFLVAREKHKGKAHRFAEEWFPKYFCVVRFFLGICKGKNDKNRKEKENQLIDSFFFLRQSLSI